MTDFFLKPFLDTLAADGIRVTISDYSRITLAMRAGGPWDLERLRGVLVALLAKNPEQEELLLRRFESFFESDLSISAELLSADMTTVLAEATGERTTAAPDKESASNVANVADERKPWRTRRYVKPIIVSVMLTLLIPPSYILIKILFSQPNPSPVGVTSTPVPTATPPVTAPPVQWGWFLVLANFALVVSLIAAAYLLFRWLSRTSLFRRRRPLFDPTAPRHFNLGVIGERPPPEFLDPAALDYLAGLVGYGPSGKMSASLDARASVDIAARSGGLPTLVYCKQQLIQTIYVVEDAGAKPSVWNSIARELAEGLALRGVPVVYGKFYGALERFETDDGATYWLDELETLNPNYPVMVFSDSRDVSHAWAAALRALARRPMLAWMELRERRFWDDKTELVARHGIPVYPATGEGTLQAFSRFQTAQTLITNYPTDKRAQHHMPAFGGDVAFQVEWLLGDALPWAQACAMMQPLTLGLADGLRCQFQPHLPPERVGRLFILPGTTHSTSGLRFSDPVLAALRSGFVMRWDDEKQEEILRYILNKIDEVEPAQKNSLAHLSWRWVSARVRLELDPNSALEDIERLVRTPLGNHIKAELENVYVAGSPPEGYARVTSGRIPVRQGVKGEFLRRRLAFITDKSDRQKTERETSADNRWGAVRALALDPMMLHSRVAEEAVGALRKSVAEDEARSLELPAPAPAPRPLKSFAAKLLNRRRPAKAQPGTGSGRGGATEEVRGLPIYKRITIGLAAGGVAGVLCNALLSVPGPAPDGGTLPHPQVSWVITHMTEPLGELFLRSLLMTAVPLAFSSLVVGIAGIGDTRRLGRVALKAFAYALAVSTISVIIGLTLANLIRPGGRIDPSASVALNRRYGEQAEKRIAAASGAVSTDTPFMWMVKTIVPSNPVASMAGISAGQERQTDTPNLLHLMFSALVMGFASFWIPSKVVAPLLNGLKSLQAVVAKILDIVMRLAPIACACLLFNTTARLGSNLLDALAWFVVTVLLGLLLLGGVYALSVYFLSRISPLEFFRRIKTVMMTAFSVWSSVATLPVALRVAEENLGVPRQINSFVLTLGATANQNGTALYQGVAVLFLAQLAGVDLTLTQQLAVAYLSVLSSMGLLAGPTGTISYIVGLLAAFNINPALVAVILGVDRLLGMCSTSLNVTGDITAATYVARSEGYELLRRQDEPAVRRSYTSREQA